MLLPLLVHVMSSMSQLCLFLVDAIQRSGGFCDVTLFNILSDSCGPLGIAQILLWPVLFNTKPNPTMLDSCVSSCQYLILGDMCQMWLPLFENHYGCLIQES